MSVSSSGPAVLRPFLFLGHGLYEIVGSNVSLGQGVTLTYHRFSVAFPVVSLPRSRKVPRALFLTPQRLLVRGDGARRFLVSDPFPSLLPLPKVSQKSSNSCPNVVHKLTKIDQQDVQELSSNGRNILSQLTGYHPNVVERYGARLLLVGTDMSLLGNYMCVFGMA